MIIALAIAAWIGLVGWWIVAARRHEQEEAIDPARFKRQE